MNEMDIDSNNPKMTFVPTPVEVTSSCSIKMPVLAVESWKLGFAGIF